MYMYIYIYVHVYVYVYVYVYVCIHMCIYITAQPSPAQSVPGADVGGGEPGSRPAMGGGPGGLLRRRSSRRRRRSCWSAALGGTRVLTGGRTAAAVGVLEYSWAGRRAEVRAGGLREDAAGLVGGDDRIGGVVDDRVGEVLGADCTA